MFSINLQMNFTSFCASNLGSDMWFPLLTPTLAGQLRFRRIGLRKWIFVVSRNFFLWIFLSKTGVKMNLRIIMKNNAADSEIGFLTKSISKPYGRATAMPPAWELKLFLSIMRTNDVISKKDLKWREYLCQFCHNGQVKVTRLTIIWHVNSKYKFGNTLRSVFT